MVFEGLGTLVDAVMTRRIASKGVKRSTLKGREDRAEAKVKKAVRTACVQRDDYCRMSTGWGDVYPVTALAIRCVGPSEWAHMHIRRRSQTRNQAPEIRHDTAHSLMLCKFHHQEYDAHRLIITALTRKGADGPLKFRRGK